MPKAPKTVDPLARFPETLYVTRTDEDGDHWFNASKSVEDVPEDDAEIVVVYERRTFGSVVTEKTFIKGEN